MKSAKHPHDSRRPLSKAVREALEADDVSALRRALSVRMIRFAEEYSIDFNGTAAAIRAGYSSHRADVRAYTLLHHAGVVRLIDDLTQSRATKIIAADPDYVVARVVEIIEAAGRDGDKLRGLELLSRILGMLKDKIEHSGPDGEAIRIEQKTSEDADNFTKLVKSLADRAKTGSDKKDVTIVG